MITGEEYRADIFKVSGFALITPFAKEFLKFNELTLRNFNIKYTAYIIVTVLLVAVGIILLQRGYEIIINESEK